MLEGGRTLSCSHPRRDRHRPRELRRASPLRIVLLVVLRTWKPSFTSSTRLLIRGSISCPRVAKRRTFKPSNSAYSNNAVAARLRLSVGRPVTGLRSGVAPSSHIIHIMGHYPDSHFFSPTCGGGFRIRIAHSVWRMNGCLATDQGVLNRLASRSPGLTPRLVLLLKMINVVQQFTGGDAPPRRRVFRP